MTLANKLIRRFEPQLTASLGAVRRAERFLGPDDDWVEDDRRIVYEAAQHVLGPLGRDTIRKKGTADYVTTAHTSPDVVETILHEVGYQRNLLSTRKYRDDHSGGRQWACGSWVYDTEETDWQHHVYLFEGPNGETDVYAHTESSVRNPKEHVSGKQKHGTALNLQRAFDSRNIEYGIRKL